MDNEKTDQDEYQEYYYETVGMPDCTGAMW